MPLFPSNPNLFSGERYYPDENLLDAVNVSLTLGMPLLITGEPGTGKTQLADAVAWELGLGEPLVFHTKSTSTYTDLFYQYDALRHFRDIQVEAAGREGNQATSDIRVQNYISFGPFGVAILLAMDRNDPLCPPEYRNIPQGRNLVLVDELDKAPRDLPNDILNELERMEFEVKEMPRGRNRFAAAPEYRPILILTSNLEKDLPDAFRRRCVFYHIEFDDLDLHEIVRRRLPTVPEFTELMLENALVHFQEIRKLNLAKRPGLAEMLAWIDLLQRLRLDVKTVKDLGDEDRVALAASYSVLAKSDDDLANLRGGRAGEEIAAAR